MQQDRDTSFDAFRGLAIIAVVAIHANGVSLSGRYPVPEGWNLFFLVTSRQMLNFPAAAFAFISGYWLSKNPINSLRDYKTFLTKRLSRILVPYLFWSFILLGYAAGKTGEINLHTTIFNLLTGAACQGYYFIIMISQLYIITPLLQYINRRPYGLALVLLLNIAGLTAAYLSRVYHVIGHIPTSLPFYSWIIFYEIGLLARTGDNRILPRKNTGSFILSFILFCVLLAELEGAALLLKYDNLPFAIKATKYSSALYSIGIILGFLFIRERFGRWPKILVTLGNYSFGIYLIHMIFLSSLADVIQKNTAIYSFQPLFQLIIILIPILICSVLIGITRRLLPKSFCRNILGF